MSVELPLVSAPSRPADWHRLASRARMLSWLSLAWMTLEGVLGVVAGVEAGSISVLTWAASSAVEGLASAIVIWRFTGSRTLSEDAERRAQRWVAVSFFVLAPYFLYESVHRLVAGEAAQAQALGIVLTASSVVGMPLLGLAKRRLGRRLGSGATAGEGTQNLLCAGQAAVALVALAAAGALPWLDPVGAVAIAAIAVWEGLELWRGEDSCCSAPLGFAPAAACCSGEQLGDDRCGRVGAGDRELERVARAAQIEREEGAALRLKGDELAQRRLGGPVEDQPPAVARAQRGLRDRGGLGTAGAQLGGGEGAGDGHASTHRRARA